MASQMQSIFRIKVTGAGLLDVNGNYDVCNALSKYPTIPTIDKTAANHFRHKPEFMYVHLSHKQWEYAIYLQPIPEMGFDLKQSLWVLARINVNNDNKASPIILYYAKRRNNDNVPPPKGWMPIGGIDPTPKTELIQLQIPKKKEPQSLLKKFMLNIIYILCVYL